MPTTYAIPNGRTVMDAPIWTGVSTSSAITISTLQFQPDLVWGKARSVGYTHGLADSVRGVSAGRLQSNSTSAEVAPSSFPYGSVSAFNSNGFTASAGSTDNENWNETNQTYVAWCWKANGTAVSNTSGSITSQVSANTTSGFSVVGWTGTGSVGTIGHGLGVTPSFIFGKRRDGTSNWFVYHTSLGATAGMNLNSTDAALTNSGWWNNTAPTSSVFTIGSFETNSGSPFIAYCYAPIAGYSAFGSYTGNGSANGPFIYLGFRARFLMIKRTDSAGSWFMVDTARNPYNIANLDLFANAVSAESVSNNIDILSNGFKPTDTNTGTNASGGTFIYAAFAENPFKYANAR